MKEDFYSFLGKTVVIVFLGGIILFMTALSLIPETDYCLDDRWCELGSYHSVCWPCSDECIITENYCQTFGGELGGRICNLEAVNYSPENCQAAGGIWKAENNDRWKCDLSAKCPYKAVEQHKRGEIK